MDFEQSIEQAEPAFDVGFHADRVICALAKASINKPLGDIDHSALRWAIQFLKNAESGYDWISKPQTKVDSESRLCVISLDTVAKSWDVGSEPVKLINDLNEMVDTLEKVDSGDSIVPELLTHTRSFFGRMLRTAINDLDKIYAGPITRESEWENQNI